MIFRHLSIAMWPILVLFAITFIGCDRRPDNLSADQLIAKGRQYYENGKTDAAVELFKQAVILKPTDGALHYEFGVMYDEECQKTYDAALQETLKEVFAGRLKQPTNNEQELIKHGYRKDFCNSAELEFSEALKYDSSNWRARYFVAANLLNKGQYEEAIPEFKRVIQQKPDYPDSYALIGKAYLQAGQYQLAIRMLDKAISMNPRESQYYALGLAYVKVKNWKKVDEIKKKLKAMNSIYYNSLSDPGNW